MFEAFGPLIALVIIYFIFALIMKAAKKASSVQKKSSGKPADPAPAPEAPAPEPAAIPQVREMQPTVRLFNHDDSIYRGSMNAVTGEGYDPCHEEQLSPLTLAETVEPESVAAPGFQLHWTGDEIVRGLVISEILKRKGA
jgi:hypothetical protein